MIEKNKNLFLNIANLKIKISTNYLKYYNYLNLYFDKIITTQNFEDEFDIEIDACWQKDSLGSYLGELKKGNSFFEIGANTIIDKKRIASIKKIGKRKKVVFDFRLENKKIYLKSIIRRKVFKDAIRYNMLGKAEEEQFFSLTYPILYYPLFWYLEYFQHTHVLHASALNFGNKGVVICGLEGIGKTSLALSLLQEKNTGFISDNLVFYDSKGFYPCYELIRIHKGEDSLLWKGRFEKVSKFKTLKDFYKPISKSNREGIRPVIFIFPQFSSSFSVQEIPKSEAMNKAVILSYLPAELSNYSEFRKLYNLLDLQFSPRESECRVLKNLLDSSHCYSVGMPKSDGLEKNYERLKDFINNE